MSVQIVLDLTEDFNPHSVVKIDTGGFDYAVVQFVNPDGSISFFHTNDSGDVQSVSDGSAVSSTNYIALQGVDLSSGTAVTSLAAAGLVRFQSYGRYLSLDGSASGVQVDKLLVRLYKIH
jgi:hypothetical protein